MCKCYMDLETVCYLLIAPEPRHDVKLCKFYQYW